MKQSYAAPTLIQHGSVEQITGTFGSVDLCNWFDKTIGGPKDGQWFFFKLSDCPNGGDDPEYPSGN